MVGVYCPIMVPAGIPREQKWIRNGIEVNETTPLISTSVINQGSTYRLVEDFESSLPATCIEYVCVLTVDEEVYTEAAQVCGEGMLVERGPPMEMCTG